MLMMCETIHLKALHEGIFQGSAEGRPLGPNREQEPAEILMEFWAERDDGQALQSHLDEFHAELHVFVNEHVLGRDVYKRTCTH